MIKRKLLPNYHYTYEESVSEVAIKRRWFLTLTGKDAKLLVDTISDQVSL